MIEWEGEKGEDEKVPAIITNEPKLEKASGPDKISNKVQKGVLGNFPSPTALI